MKIVRLCIGTNDSDKKIPIIKALREALPITGLLEAKNLMEAMLLRNVPVRMTAEQLGLLLVYGSIHNVRFILTNIEFEINDAEHDFVKAA